MLDLSEEPKAENIALCKEYLEKLAPLNVWLEMEIGGWRHHGLLNDLSPTFGSASQVSRVARKMVSTTRVSIMHPSTPNRRTSGKFMMP